MPTTEAKPLRGYLWFYYETGYEGSVWAFQDERLESYDGMRIQKTGDELKIFDKENPGRTVWSGTLDLTIPKINFLGWEIATHDQVGVDPGQWAKWFAAEYPA